MKFEVFSQISRSELRELVNDWLEANKGKIEIESTHFSTSSEDEDTDYGKRTITRFSAAIYYRD